MFQTYIFCVVFSHLTNGVHPRDVAIPFFSQFFFFLFVLICLCFERGFSVMSGSGLTTLTNKKEISENVKLIDEFFVEASSTSDVSDIRCYTGA